MQPSSPIIAFVDWPSAPLTNSLVRKALQSLCSPITVVSSQEEFTKSTSRDRLIQWSTYDHIDHELTHLHREDVLSSSYTYRKGLIRKHFLSRCIHIYVTKNPKSCLNGAFPRTFEIEISFADELDEMWTDELWELNSLIDNPGSWWILKPGMADRGMGIRLFNSRDVLQQIFEGFEEDADDTDDEARSNSDSDNRTAVVTSQLRHFVIQEYLIHPLLMDPSEVTSKDAAKVDAMSGHKFHLRAYCISSGALQLYLYNRVLALFSAVPYELPTFGNDGRGDGGNCIDLTPHLTNTSIQTIPGEDVVRLLDELVGCHVLSQSDKTRLTREDVTSIISQMSDILAETFRAAIQSSVHFQPLPNAFELFGVDFLLTHETAGSSKFEVKILEINAEPAIEMTGHRLTWVLEDLFIAAGKVCVEPFLRDGAKYDQQSGESWAVGQAQQNLVKCLDVELRGGFC